MGTIEKITGLLRVGIGEAGSAIIVHNLDTKRASDKINTLLPGARVYVIVGFCDIHMFEEVNWRLGKVLFHNYITNNNIITNVIGVDILEFANTVAEIVHNSVFHWNGQCNKNLGNAFVIIWRIGDEETVQAATSGGSSKGQFSLKRTSDRQASDDVANSPTGPLQVGRGGANSSSSTGRSRQVELRRVPGVDLLADRALISYLKIIVEVNRSKKSLYYRSEPRLTRNGTEDFKIRMGFGLHAGWAIEGAVGSAYKIDATYLSPHVNMAARLETSSRQYGVPILVSEIFYDLLTAEVKETMRKIDVITVKGSEVPIGIYTYDANQERDFVEKLTRRQSSLVISKGGTVPPRLMTVMDDTVEIFQKDPDLLYLRAHVNEKFFTVFRQGLEKYLEGKWTEAKTFLQQSNEMMKTMAPVLNGDGPSLTLLEYMEELQFEAPADWKGFRPLTSK